MGHLHQLPNQELSQLQVSPMVSTVVHTSHCRGGKGKICPKTRPISPFKTWKINFYLKLWQLKVTLRGRCHLHIWNKQENWLWIRAEVPKLQVGPSEGGWHTLTLLESWILTFLFKLVQHAHFEFLDVCCFKIIQGRILTFCHYIARKYKVLLHYFEAVLAKRMFTIINSWWWVFSEMYQPFFLSM